MSNKTSSSALILIGLLLIIIGVGAPWNTGLYYVNLLDYKLYLVSIFLLTSLPIFWMVEFKQQSAKVELSKSQLFLLLFFAIASVSVLWSEDYSLFLNKWFIYVFGFVTFYVVLKIENSHKNHIYIALLLSIVSILISGIGIAQYLYDMPAHSTLAYGNIPASTFGNKNAANQLIVLVFPAIVFLLISKVNRVQFFVGALALVCALFYVYYATTKSAWIAIVFESLIMLIYWCFVKKNFSSNISALFKVFSFLLVIAMFVALDLGSIKSGFNSDSKVDSVISSLSDRYNSSESPRKKIWHSAINIANKSPIYGHSLGAFPHQLAVEGSLFRLKKVHNDLLETYVELGFIGLVVFILFLFYLIKDWLLINRSNVHKDALFFNLLMIAFSGSFINMMVSWPYQSIHGVVLFAVFSGLIISKARLNNKIYTYNPPVVIKLIVMPIVLIVLIFTFLTVKSWTSSLSNFYFHSGMDGYKFNYAELVKYSPLIPFSDIHLSKVAEGYWNVGYHERASKVYKIASDLNPDNMLALYRQFITAIDQKYTDKARSLFLIMRKNNRLHPLTFRASVNLYRAKGDIVKAKESYYFYKRYFNSLNVKDVRAYKALHHWSIILGIYTDTPSLYSTYIESFKKDVNVENNMANFYVYTQQYNKAVVHIKYVIDNKPDVIKPAVFKILQEKGFVD
jgi:O-antigen ligase/tetratricopeptide (TPR) repeat protein